MISWITCAKRQLEVNELRHALAVEIGERQVDEDNLLEADDMVSVCAGLVTVDQETEVIRLVHYTTQDYFQRNLPQRVPDIEAVMTNTCLTYLCFEAFDAGCCTSNDAFKARAHDYAFLRYAADLWGEHALEAPEEAVETLALGLLEDEVKVECAVQVQTVSSPKWFNSQNFPKRRTGMHLVASFGLLKLMQALLNRGQLSDPRDEQGKSPLSCAAEKGKLNVVQLLIQRNDVDVNSESDLCNANPL